MALETGPRSFSSEQAPAMPTGSAIEAFFCWNDAKVILARDGYQIGIKAGNNTGTLYVFNGETWKHSPGLDVDTAETVQTDRFGFVRSRDDSLYLITPDQVVKLDGPGRCDAITKSSKGNLLASFGPAGIFERKNDKWEKRADSPFTSETGEHWTHLAEADGEIALVTSQVPQLIAGTDKFVHTGTAGIWITKNGKFERIDLGK